MAESAQSYCEKRRTVTYCQESKRLFEILFNDLSIRAQHTLIYHDINSIEDLAPWIEGEFDSFLKFRNCGKLTSDELMEMVLCLRTKVELSCQVDSETAPMNQEIGQSLIETIAKANKNKTQSQRQFDRLFNLLSVRARNVLLANCILDCESFLTLAAKPISEIIKLRSCGKKTVQELLDAANRLMKTINEAEETDGDSIFSIDGIIQFDKDSQKYLTMFKKEYGHWPMMFVLLSKIKSLLKPREFAAFEDRFGIWKHEELEELTKQGIHQLFERTVEKLQADSALKILCEYEDWSLYNVNIIPVPFFKNEEIDCKWQEVEQMITKEKFFLKNCYCDDVSTGNVYKEQLELLSRINISTFKVFLLFWGHLPLWQWNNRLVPYCPQEKKGYYDPQSPIVFDKRFASFNFNKSFVETCRLKKKKTDNDIILSIEKCFVDNEDYWKQFVNLSKEDKATLVLLLKKLFRDLCGAIIADDNLIIKATRADFGEILYEILTIEGKRLHRNELLLRLKKVCNERGVNCNYSNPAQIIPFLVKDSRIVSYGKSSYWGLKEWGESYGSIRELALGFVKESNEPIHIDKLTKLVKERRPDSNEKSISAIIKQTTTTGELLLFFGDLIGHPKANYVSDYIQMPQSFDEWLRAFRGFVLKKKRFPNAGLEFEGCLYRWYQRARQLTELSSEEILKIDALEIELVHYPHNMTEYKFLHNCNLYKKFVEGNNRMLEETDDPQLFKWFYNASLNFGTYKDNRSGYFNKLLQFLSKILF